MIQLRFGVAAVIIEICVQIQVALADRRENICFLNSPKMQTKIIQFPLSNSQRLKMDNTNPKENVLEGGTQKPPQSNFLYYQVF